MLLVTPKLTSEPEIYGIYTLCLSLTIFFSYADLGFLGAGQKFAAESYARKESGKELEIISFTIFFLSIFILICCAFLFLFYLNIHWLIKKIDPSNVMIARQMILILICSAPVIILQRLNSLIYSIRVEDYKMQAIDVVSNVIKILSIGFFINNGRYDIVGYFLTIQVISLVSSLISTILAFIQYNYSFLDFLKAFRFNLVIFNLTKHLAISSLLITIAWVLYFEMDSMILSKFYGLNVLAIYGIGFVMVSFIRTLYNVVFSPFLSIFNHKIGIGNEDGMYSTFGKLIMIIMPLLVLVPIILCVNMPSIIDLWVGGQYVQGVGIYRILVIMIGLTGLSIPLSHLIIALSGNQILRINALILPVFFYLFLICLHSIFQHYNLAVSKLITILISVITSYYLFSKRYKNLSIYFVKPTLYITVCGVIAYFLWFLLAYLLPNGFDIYGKIGRLLILVSVPFIFGSMIYYLTLRETRDILFSRFNLVNS